MKLSLIFIQFDKILFNFSCCTALTYSVNNDILFDHIYLYFIAFVFVPLCYGFILGFQKTTLEQELIKISILKTLPCAGFEIVTFRFQIQCAINRTNTFLYTFQTLKFGFTSRKM